MRDVTEYIELQAERQKVHLMKMLHTIVSHDMMAPIINIKYFADMMLKSGISRDLHELQKYYNLIIDSGRLVQCRVKDLLDQNLIEHSSFNPVEVNFYPVAAIKQICNMLETQMKHDDVQIFQEYDNSIRREMVGDLDRIQQVLLNLTSNARKFAPKFGGLIKIRAELRREEGDHKLVVSVADNGPGISPED